jgi:hypothetical protein
VTGAGDARMAPDPARGAGGRGVAGAGDARMAPDPARGAGGRGVAGAGDGHTVPDPGPQGQMAHRSRDRCGWSARHPTREPQVVAPAHPRMRRAVDQCTGGTQ